MPDKSIIKIANVEITKFQYQFIQSAVTRGYSANAIQRGLSSAGMGIQRQNLLSVVRELKGEEKKKDAWKYTPTKFGISDSAHETARMKMDMKYAYTVRVDVYSDVLGTEAERWVRVKSDIKLPQRKIYEEAESALEDLGVFSTYNEKVISSKIYRPLIRPD